MHIKDIKVRAGDPIDVNLRIAGSPAPTITWQKAGERLRTTDRITVNVGETYAKLHISPAAREDSDTYLLTVENNLGKETANFKITVVGKLIAVLFILL